MIFFLNYQIGSGYRASYAPLLHKQKGKEVPSKGGKLEGQTCKQQRKQVRSETSRSK